MEVQMSSALQPLPQQMYMTPTPPSCASWLRSPRISALREHVFPSRSGHVSVDMKSVNEPSEIATTTAPAMRTAALIRFVLPRRACPFRSRSSKEPVDADVDAPSPVESGPSYAVRALNILKQLLSLYIYISLVREAHSPLSLSLSHTLRLYEYVVVVIRCRVRRVWCGAEYIYTERERDGVGETSCWDAWMCTPPDTRKSELKTQIHERGKSKQ